MERGRSISLSIYLSRGIALSGNLLRGGERDQGGWRVGLVFLGLDGPARRREGMREGGLNGGRENANGGLEGDITKLLK